MLEGLCATRGFLPQRVIEAECCGPVAQGRRQEQSREPRSSGRCSDWSLSSSWDLNPVPGLLPADFGFAQHMSPWDEKHVLRGSPLYMAPEMVCRRQYDARVDLWSVGVILYGETFVPLLSTPIVLHLGKASPGPSWVLMRIEGLYSEEFWFPSQGWARQDLTLFPSSPPPPPLPSSAEALFGKPPFASRSFSELEEKIRSNRVIEVRLAGRVLASTRD